MGANQTLIIDNPRFAAALASQIHWRQAAGAVASDLGRVARHGMNLPYLMQAGTRRLRTADHIPLQRHPGAIELYYVEKGVLTFLVGENAVVAKGGDCVVIPDGVPHRTGSLPAQPSCYHWLIIAVPPPLECRWGLSKGQTRALFARLALLGGRPLRLSVADHVHFAALLDLLASKPPYAELGAMGELLALLFAVANADLRQKEDGLESRVSEWVRSRLDERLAIGDLARAVGSNANLFAAEFRRAAGISVHQYILHIKMEEARRRLLAPGATVLRVALDLGFATQAHFAATFKRYTGCSPMVFRKRILGLARSP